MLPGTVTTASLTLLPRYASASVFSFCRMNAPAWLGEYVLPPAWGKVRFTVKDITHAVRTRDTTWDYPRQDGKAEKGQNAWAATERLRSDRL